MRLLLASGLLAISLVSMAQEKTESRELIGQLGNRDALLVLHATQRPDGGWRVAGEYTLLATLVRRFVEGERSPELGVTTLKEGTSAILYGRPATGELRGTWRAGTFKGVRHGPGGQERERFEFNEEFPSLDAYSGAVRCDSGAGRYRSSLSFTVDAGKLEPGSFDWRSSIAPAGPACSLAALEQQPVKGGLQFASGQCRVLVREVGEFLMVNAEGCEQRCGSQAHLEPMLVDRRGQCRLLHPQAQ